LFSAASVSCYFTCTLALLSLNIPFSLSPGPFLFCAAQFHVPIAELIAGGDSVCPSVAQGCGYVQAFYATCLAGVPTSGYAALCDE